MDPIKPPYTLWVGLCPTNPKSSLNRFWAYNTMFNWPKIMWIFSPLKIMLKIGHNILSPKALQFPQ